MAAAAAAAAAAARPIVSLFYDVASPYSWLAFEVLTRYYAVHATRFDLKLKPVFLGGIMRASENQPPGFNMAKRVYMARDLERQAQYLDVPLQQPSDFSVITTSLPAQRLLTAVFMTQPQAMVEEVSRALWLRIWGRDQSIAQPEDLDAACRAAGIEDDAMVQGLLDDMKGDTCKQRLKEVTQEAIDIGAFGAPTIVVQPEGPVSKIEDGDMFFGADRFHLVMPLIGVPWNGAYPTQGASRL